MSKQKAVIRRIPLSTYIEPEVLKQIRKKRGERGVISWSAYLRILVIEDLEKE